MSTLKSLSVSCFVVLHKYVLLFYDDDDDVCMPFVVLIHSGSAVCNIM